MKSVSIHPHAYTTHKDAYKNNYNKTFFFHQIEKFMCLYTIIHVAFNIHYASYVCILSENNK